MLNFKGGLIIKLKIMIILSHQSSLAQLNFFFTLLVYKYILGYPYNRSVADTLLVSCDRLILNYSKSLVIASSIILLILKNRKNNYHVNKSFLKF